MSLWLKFSGWFQCRLATDPDPCDEPRGISGYAHALAGEPHLDRIIRLQPEGTVPRSHCPKIGVTVTAVTGDARRFKLHPLLGAAVELLDSPKFEGRNHILAEDGFEAIVPFHLRIRQGKFRLQRNFDDSFKFPPLNETDRGKFAQLQSTGLNVSPGAIGEATGIYDLTPVWAQRIAQLKADLARSSEIEKAAIQSRVATMSNSFLARYFAARMLYSVLLGGKPAVHDPDGFLPGAPDTSPKAPWPVDLWFGAWDADAFCGYVTGYLDIPFKKEGTTPGLAAMVADKKQRRG